MTFPAYKRTTRNPNDLTLGLELPHVGYTWRPYDERLPEHREDYDKLKEDMVRSGGLANPLIVFRDAVLIGMRRCEIARALGWEAVPCLEITEDISRDRDASRVLALRDQLYEPIDYGGPLPVRGRGAGGQK